MTNGVPIVTEDDDTDIIGFQVECHAPDPRPELDHLAGLDLVEPDHPSNTVTDGNDRSELLDIVLE